MVKNSPHKRVTRRYRRGHLTVKSYDAHGHPEAKKHPALAARELKIIQHRYIKAQPQRIKDTQVPSCETKIMFFSSFFII